MLISFTCLIIILVAVLLYKISGDESFLVLATISLVSLLISLVVEWDYQYQKYRGINVTVKDGQEILYKGNSAFYDIESMGTATYFVEKEPRAWFPRMLNERVSNNITVIK